ncbi:MAG: DUF2029 domain-containing protein [Candidatus Omnitrophica bacterium]|nr:DUF2029 domain-containing protein [Candidatus Omnitrophota bacterium]
MKRPTDAQLLLTAALLFISFLVFRGVEDMLQENYGDFHSYFKGGLALRTGAPLYFDPEEPSFRYSPFFALLMAPLTILPKQAAYFLWQILMITQFLAILHWGRELADKSGLAGSPTPLWLYGSSLILIPNFVMANFDKGQANIFLLFWLLCGWLLLQKNRPCAAGVCLAISILTKVTSILILPFLLWRREFKCLAGSLISLVVLLLVPWTLNGFPDGFKTLRDWIVWTRQAHDHYFLAGQANQSLFAAIHRLVSRQESAYMTELGFATLRAPIELVKLTYAIFGAILYAAFLARANKRISQSPYGFSATFVDFCGILLAVTLIFPVAWKYAFVNLLLPIMVILIYLFRNGGRDFPVLALLAGFFVLATVLPSSPVRSIRMQAHFYSSITWGTLLLALAFLKLKHRPLHISSTQT